MDRLSDTLRTRVIPAVLTAAGVAFVTAGLLTYTGPVEADPGVSPEPTQIAIEPTPAPTRTPLPSFSLPPTVSPSPSVTPSFPPDRVATRVVIGEMGIDLPVMKQPDPSYPACNVAMYHEALLQPGMGKAIYLYAHARTGMFLSLLEESKRNDGQRMIGMLVQVYTGDNRLFLYEVTEVLRHQKTLDRALAATTEELWLQTSEQPPGPPGVITPKLQLVAKPLSEGEADPVAAHPEPHPVACR
jgi:hypothetical protein